MSCYAFHVNVLQTAVRAAAVLTLFSSSAAASLITFIGSDSVTHHSYSASFSVVGSNLQLVLTNTGTTASAVDTDILGSLFFTVSGGTTLTPVSAALGSGSSYVNGSGTIGQRWEYLAGLGGVSPNGQSMGVSAVGYSIFGSANFCSSGCNSVSGIDYGLATSNYVAGSGNGSIKSTTLIESSAVFTFSGIPNGFDPSTSITNVEAQYGSAINTAYQVTGVAVPTPEPSTVLFGAVGLAGLLFSRRFRYLS
jgi:hypothetical protein